MDRTAVLEQVQAVIAKTLEVDTDEVAETAQFVDDLDADSLDLLELVIGLKDVFGISVRDGEVKELLIELARFLPDGTTTLSDTASDEEFAEVTRRLTVGTLVDFVMDRVSGSVNS